MAQITFIISGGTPDYTVTIEGYMGSPSEWVFNAPGQYTIQVDYQEAYRLLIVDSRGCTASDDYGYTRPDSLINFYIISRVNFNDGTNIYIKDMTPQDACDALLAKCEDNLANGNQGGTGQIANNPPLIGDTVYAYWYTDSLIKFNDGTFIFTTEWNGSRCGIDKYIGHIEDGVITEMILCTLPATTTTTTLEPTTTTTTTTCDPSKCDYGLLYNWYAVDTSKLAPTGWHVPSSNEWETLRLYIAAQGWNYDGTTDVGTSADNKQGKALASTCNWGYNNDTGTVGNTDYPDKRNISGFSGLPAGQRRDNYSNFIFVGDIAAWWSTSLNIYGYPINYSLFFPATYLSEGWNSHKWGLSIRCVRTTYEGWEEDVPVVDYDGNEYDVVEIGTQLWLVQNLVTTHLNDGTPIPEVTDNSAWNTLTTPAFCAYNNDWSYACKTRPVVFDSIKYGNLYNWYAATDLKNICASGWRVPESADFNSLILFLDPSGTEDNNVAGGELKETGLIHWNSPNTGATNSVGFNARGGGARIAYSMGMPYDFFMLKDMLTLWAKTEGGNLFGYDTAISPCLFNDSALLRSGEYVKSPKYAGSYLRLIKNSTSLSHGQTGTYTGNDGKVYRTICIGTQEWLADNLAETKYRNGDTIPTVTDNTTWAGLTTGAKCAYDNIESNVGYEGVCSTTTTTTSP